MNVVEDIKRLSDSIKVEIVAKDATIKEQRQTLIEVKDLLQAILNASQQPTQPEADKYV